MKHYLVTGGAGFIGSNFVKYILKKHTDIQIIVLDDLTYAGNLGTISKDLEDSRLEFIKGNIVSHETVESVFEKYSIDTVVNFAAESHVDRSIENPQLFLETNILGTQNLLDTARKFWAVEKDSTGYPVYQKGVKFLQVSTDEVYGSLGETGYFTETTPLNPRSPYSASKAAADFIVLAYAETYKMPVNITRCSNNYGPYHFPEKLIPLIIKNILEGKKLPVYGDGSNVRDWLYVEDHCNAIDLVVTRGRLGQVYNVGGHNEMKNIDIVRLTISTVRRLLEENPEYKKALKTDIININDNLITFVKDRLGHDRRYAIDPAKISSELGWTPETRFADGIVKTIRWYLENQNWVDEVTSGDYQKYYRQMYGSE
ncbi:MAG: dTDP-glucose 4,6-dehydratase [Dysgonamonadaceae bacterium]|jgi:dTDP-glucose 4,6-dehydratase|nr:dTDP-glucose 4,6-dehydratase [Dysgonamonadaceae bacterium]